MIAITRQPARNMDACEITYVHRQPLDSARAAAQHRDYCRALEACGVSVITLPPIDTLPDSVFVEDTAIVLDELAVLTMPGASSRRAEIDAIQPEISRLRNIKKISLPATIEGGDVMRVGKRLFVGLSPRTNIDGVEELRRLISPQGYEVRTVGMRDCLHLKSGCTAIAEDTILVNPEWIESEIFHEYQLVLVDQDEAWAANTLRVGNYVLMGAQFPKTAAKLKARRLGVTTVDVSEFAKVEGGLTCMSLLFEG